MVTVRRYAASDMEAWNDFVAHSKQGTFLFNRGYMDYHSDRFHDHSLMVFHRKKLFAVLPANKVDDVFWTHQGLTYGGLLTNSKATVAEICDVFRTINAYLKGNGFHKVVYKAIPWIYHRLPAEEDLYALTNVCGARLAVRHVSTTLSSHRLCFSESRRSGVRKAARNGIVVIESDDICAFWTILNDNLQRQYGTRPVHSMAELQILRDRFPCQIRLFMAFKHDTPMGGTLVFEAGQVIHTQYISATPEGKAEGALDAVFDHLLHHVYSESSYFDFGKSSNGDGHDLNENLVFQKEGFGGRAVCYDWYEYIL